MKKRNESYWHWHTNSYPTNEGIHFSFATMNFALRFMRKFKTSPFYKITDQTGRDWYSIKILDQDSPTEEQYKWLKRCKMDAKEKSMTFDEFKRGYKMYEGPKPKEGKGDPAWYIESLDYSKGRGYQGNAGNESAAIWTLLQTFNSLRNRGEL